MKRHYLLFLLACLMIVCRAAAQPPITPFMCADDCSNPWALGQKIVNIVCPGPPVCSTDVVVDFQWRPGCQDAVDVKILGWRALLPGGEHCIMDCSISDALAKLFVGIVENPPTGFPAMGTAGEPCQSVVQFQAAHCYGYEWPVQGHPTWAYCDGSTCCRAKYVVCRSTGSGRVNKIGNRT